MAAFQEIACSLGRESNQTIEHAYIRAALHNTQVWYVRTFCATFYSMRLFPGLLTPALVAGSTNAGTASDKLRGEKVWE